MSDTSGTVIFPDGTEKEFNLETQVAGVPPSAVIEELRHARRVAKDMASAYGDAVGAQAEKYGVKKGALKRFIAALEDDGTEDAIEEARDLERLIDAI
jgi:hypothetical protein